MKKRPRNPLIDFMIFLKRRDYKYQMPLVSGVSASPRLWRYRAYHAVDINQAEQARSTVIRNNFEKDLYT